jgi:rhamnose transport system substrate-binding protein
MKANILRIVAALTILSILVTACAPVAPATQPAAQAEPTKAAEPTTAPEATKAPETAPAAGTVIEAKPGESFDAILLPKFMGNLVFDQANQGAEEAKKELQNPGKLTYTGPTAENSVAGQIEVVTNAPTQGAKAVMISNNSGDQLGPAAQAAREKGVTVVTWDSPIPSAQGEQVFVAQVDFNQMGATMADMALDILGADGGKFAVLSASPDAANQNAWIAAMKEALKDPKYSKLELVDTVYGNDQSEDSYNQALALVSKYPDMKLIMSPTTIGIAAAAKAMQDEKLCDKVKVSGLGLPSEMAEFTKNGCAPEFALWSFVDLGYLTYYVTYLLATGQMEAKEGVSFKAGRMGDFTITKDPTRDQGLRVLMGPFTKYTKDNVDAG